MMVVSFGGGRMIGNLPFHCLVAVKRSKPWNLENPPHELYSLPLPPPSLQEGREREREIAGGKHLLIGIVPVLRW